MDDWLAQAMDKEIVEIPEGVTEIPNGAFRDNKNVRKITFPSTLEAIGKEAFYGCARLKISPLPSSLKTIGERAFFGCTSIEKFETGKSNDRSFWTLKGVLYDRGKRMVAYPAGCREKAYEVLDNTETIEDYAFCGCEHLRTIDLGPNVSEVTARAFSGCRKLNAVQIAGENERFISMSGDLYSDMGTVLVYMTPRPRRRLERLTGVERLEPGCLADCDKIDALVLHDCIEDIAPDAFGDLCRPKKLYIDKNFDCDLPFSFWAAEDGGRGEMETGNIYRRRKDGTYEKIDVIPPHEDPFGEFCGPERIAYGDDSLDVEDMDFRPVSVAGACFDSIAGLEDAKALMYQNLVLPAKHPDLFDRFDLETTSGVLLYGPPGTGKTMLARAVASEMDAKFYSVKSTDIRSCWVGNSEKNIRRLFETAREDQRAVIFFDDFDSLGRSRGTHGEPWQSDLIDEILVQMQGVERHKGNLMVLAATNRPWDIDSALKRSGRFTNQIYVGLPNVDAREKIIRNRISGVPHAVELDLRDVAIRTEGYNGADVEEVCRTAKMHRILQMDSGSTTDRITAEDFEYALSSVYSSVSKKDVRDMENYRRTGGDPDAEEYVPDKKDSVPGYS